MEEGVEEDACQHLLLLAGSQGSLQQHNQRSHNHHEVSGSHNQHQQNSQQNNQNNQESLYKGPSQRIRARLARQAQVEQELHAPEQHTGPKRCVSLGVCCVVGLDAWRAEHRCSKTCCSGEQHVGPNRCVSLDVFRGEVGCMARQGSRNRSQGSVGSQRGVFLSLQFMLHQSTFSQQGNRFAVGYKRPTF
eukprot:1158232-Pelagomonas_calceolata.AAC.2